MEIALSLMDELGEPGERERWESRAGELIRLLTAEYRQSQGRRGWFMPIDDLEDPVEGVEEGYALGVMPYALAALLLAEDAPELADFFQGRYEELQGKFERSQEAESMPIADLYGGLAWEGGW